MTAAPPVAVDQGGVQLRVRAATLVRLGVQDPHVVSVVTAVAVLVVATAMPSTGGWGVLRASAGLVAALVAPGAAVTLTLRVGGLDALSAVAVAVVSSFAWYACLGAVVVTAGLRLTVWPVVAVTAVACVVTVIAHLVLVDPGRTPAAAAWPRMTPERWGWVAAVLIAVDLVGVTAVVALRALPVTAPPVPYQALALAGPWAALEGPVDVQPGRVQVPVRLGGHGDLRTLVTATLEGSPSRSTRTAADGTAVVTAEVRDRGCTPQRLRIGAASLEGSAPLTLYLRTPGTRGCD